MTELKNTFAKKERLCSEKQVTELFLEGFSFLSYPVRVVWRTSEVVGESSVQVVMSVSKKKLKHAVDRNRVKRLFREAYRLNKHPLVQQAAEQNLSLRMAFIWIPGEILEYSRVEKKVREALAKMQKLLAESSVPEPTAGVVCENEGSISV
jgi:ribonuclease P protein component